MQKDAVLLNLRYHTGIYWRYCGKKRRKISVRIASLRAGIRTRYLQNTKHECDPNTDTLN
jgi:hypothetical protein